MLSDFQIKDIAMSISDALENSKQKHNHIKSLEKGLVTLRKKTCETIADRVEKTHPEAINPDKRAGIVLNQKVLHKPWLQQAAAQHLHESYLTALKAFSFRNRSPE